MERETDEGGSCRRPETGLRAREGVARIVVPENVAIYDLDPDVIGRFDFAFIGSLLLHLRDPVRALAAVARVLDGELLVADSVSIYLSLAHPLRPTARFEARDRVRWWVPNTLGLRSMIVVAGYEVLSNGGPYFIPVGKGFRPMKLRNIKERRARRFLREVVLSLERLPSRLGSGQAQSLRNARPARSLRNPSIPGTPG